jgi:hypothetical protein
LVIGTAVSLTYTYRGLSGSVPLTPAMSHYVATFGAFDYALLALSTLAGLSAATALLLLKRSALYFFFVVLALQLFAVWLYATPERYAVLGSYAYLTSIWRTAVRIAIILYCWRLIKRGVLT